MLIDLLVKSVTDLEHAYNGRFYARIELKNILQKLSYLAVSLYWIVWTEHVHVPFHVEKLEMKRLFFGRKDIFSGDS